jgi:metal-responsive CopG/Arc/MetJ family transcriptional regulator
MSQKPLSPEGGEAASFKTRLPHRELERLDQIARKQGFPNRSEYVRAVLTERLDQVEAEEASARAS